ncbi:hypothetical protein N9B82_06865, partial [Saprospiraceae bacterium]|nr:hypothetical protein [Saprospiraceae bacterium]
MKPTDLHNEIFNHLISREVRFKPRVQDDDRLRSGYWFIGNDEYINLSFWDGYDPHRHIHRIAFAYDYNGKQEAYLNLSARDDDSEASILRELANEIGAEERPRNHWVKIYGIGIDDSSTVIKHLDDLIDNDLAVINKYIPRLTTVSTITRDKFEKNVSKINEARESLGLTPAILPTKPKARKTITTRTGVTSKAMESYLRKTLASEKEILPVHNELQNRLFENLKSQFPDSYLMMEEDYIDLLLKTGDQVYLYEVKPYDSPTRCIREGLGQLMYYCSQH